MSDTSPYHILVRGPAWVRGLIFFALMATLGILNQGFLVDARSTRAESTLLRRSEVLYVPQAKVVRFLTLNYKQAAADLLWLRTIGYFAQHFDTDRQYKWLEHFLEQVLSLDPKFKKVYHWAGTNVLYGRRFTNYNVGLSNRFYLLALEQFPEDYEAAYRLGLNFYIEMKSNDKEEKRRYKEIGLSYLELAANMPSAPRHLRSLVASISSKLGKQQLALQYYIDLYLRTENVDEKALLKARIDELKANTQLGALTEQLESFERRWKAHHPYVPPSVFTLIDPGVEVTDVDWHTLLPDVVVTLAEESP